MATPTGCKWNTDTGCFYLIILTFLYILRHFYRQESSISVNILCIKKISGNNSCICLPYILYLYNFLHRFLWSCGCSLILCRKYYNEEDGLTLDVGAFAKALEYATGVTAKIVGKPQADFFHAAVKDMGVSPNEVGIVTRAVELC